MPPPDKLLLCRPQGGLNDILSEVGKCLAYARKFNRLLIVETDYVNTHHFQDRFDHYFISHDDRMILNAAPFRGQIAQHEVKPAIGINDYDSGLGGAPLTFDFAIDHAEPLLLHDSAGRQKKWNAQIALASLSLAPALREALQKRLVALGPNFTALHIRHTDYKTDYKRNLLKINFRGADPIFLATDNAAVVADCTALLGKTRVMTFTALTSKPGQPLHHGQDRHNVRQRNEDAILDVLTLASAKHLIFFRRDNGRREVLPTYSGFSVLADRLHHDRRLLHFVTTGQWDDRLPTARPLSKWWRGLIRR